MAPAPATFTSHDIAPAAPAFPADVPEGLARRFRESADWFNFGGPIPPGVPAITFDDAPGYPAGLYRGATGATADRKAGKDLPRYWSEIDLRGYRVMSRWLWETNPFMLGFGARLTDYHVGKGWQWQACRKGQEKQPYATGRSGDDLLKKAQTILDEWRDSVAWPMLSREGFRRLHRDGEVIQRLTPGRNGLAEHRFVNPEQVGSPTGDSDGRDSFGVRRGDTPQDGGGRPVEVYVRDHDGDDRSGQWESCDSRDPRARVLFHKTNTDSDVKRGLPDSFSVHETMDEARKLVRNMVVAATAQAAIAWLEKFPTATAEQVRSLIPTGYPQLSAPTWGASTGETVYSERLAAGTVLRTEGSREFAPGPTSGSVGNYIEAEQAALRMVCVRWGFPPYLTAKADDINFASSLTAGSPFAVAVEGGQVEWGVVERATAAKVLDLAAEAGRLTWAERDAIDVEVVAPAVTSPDKKADTDRLLGLLREKVVDPYTVQQELGYDPSHIEANWDAWEKRRAEGVGADDSLRGSLASVSAIQQLQTAVAGGQLTAEAAVANLHLVFGIDPAQAAKLFPPKEAVDLTPDGSGPDEMGAPGPFGEAVYAARVASGEWVTEARAGLVAKKVTVNRSTGPVQTTVWVKSGEKPAGKDAPLSVGDALKYTGRGADPSDAVELRGFHTDPASGKKMARVIFRPKSGPPFETSVDAADIARAVTDSPRGDEAVPDPVEPTPEPAPPSKPAAPAAYRKPEVKESWKGGPPVAPLVEEAFDFLPDGLRAVGSPRVVISPGTTSSYSFGQIYLDPERTPGELLQTTYVHEFGHHAWKELGLTNDPQFTAAMGKAIERAGSIAAEDLLPPGGKGSVVEDHNVGLFLQAVKGEEWGTEAGYMAKNDNHKQEVFCTALANYVHYNPRFWKQFPELKAYFASKFDGEAATESAGSLAALLDAALTRLLEDRGNLVKKTITNKAGHKQTVYVSPADAGADEAPAADPIPREHVLAGLSGVIHAADPELAANPTRMAKVADAALTAAAKAYGAFAKLTPHILTAQRVLEGVFDTPGDMQKFGYNPGTSGTANAGVADPVKGATGVSAHLAAQIAAHVLGKAWSHLTKKAKPKAAESIDMGTGDPFDAIAAALREAVAHVAAELGLPEPPDAATIAAALRERAKAVESVDEATFAARVESGEYLAPECDADGVLTEARDGLVKKTVTVQRGGKSVQTTVWVKLGEEPGPKASPPGEPGKSSGAPELAPALAAFAAAPEGSRVRLAIDNAVANASPAGHDASNPPPALELERVRRFRYDLAAQHADMHDAGMLTPEDDAAFVDVMKSLGIEPLHEPGEVKPFDPETMESPFGVSTGTPVKVIRRGWAGLYGDAGVGTELTGKNYRRAVVGRAD